MSNPFLAALAAKSPVTAAPKETPKPKNSDWTIKPSEPIAISELIEANNELEVRIEVRHDTGKIELFFNKKPPLDIRQWMKSYGFWYNDTPVKFWHVKDTPNNRVLIETKFNVNINEPEEIKPISTQPIETDPIPENASPEYVKFKQQVNELMAELKIDAADLMLLAVDCLHKTKFGKN